MKWSRPALFREKRKDFTGICVEEEEVLIPYPWPWYVHPIPIESPPNSLDLFYMLCVVESDHSASSKAIAITDIDQARNYLFHRGR